MPLVTKRTMPPHQNHLSRNGVTTDSRFPKHQLMSMYTVQKESGELDKDLTDLFLGGWQPGTGSHANATLLWTPRDEHGRDAGPGPDICWDRGGNISPLGLREMNNDEKELFSTSVNSPLKPPPQAGTREQNASGNAVTRKTSFSQGQNSGASFGVSSPPSVRPPVRRRETSDSVSHASNFMSSPGGSGRVFRDANHVQTPPPLLLRRKTDVRDGPLLGAQIERDKEAGSRDGPLDASGPFSGLSRRGVTAGLGTTANNPSLPWSSTGASFSPMGAFASFGLPDTSRQPTTPGEKKPTYGSLRGASRWSKLMNKDHSEDGAPSEKQSIGNLGRLSEADVGVSPRTWGEARSNRPMSNETDPFGEKEGQSSNAPFVSARDVSLVGQHGGSNLGTPTAQKFGDGHGFPGMVAPSNLSGFRDVVHDRGGHQLPGGAQQNGPGEGEPLSPTETNPYQSPLPERAEPEDVDTDDSDIQNLHHPGLSSISISSGLNRYRSVPRGLPAGADGFLGDRSHLPSSGPPPSRGFPSLGSISSLSGLGGAAGWPPTSGSIARADRDPNGFPSDFGSSLFSPMGGDLPSSGVGPSGGLAGMGFGGSGTAGRNSKLSSLFPSAMQAQLHGGDLSKPDPETGSGELKEQPQQKTTVEEAIRATLDQFGPSLTATTRDTESPFRSNRGLFDEMLPGNMGDNRNRRSTENSIPSIDPLAAAFGASLVPESSQAPLPAVGGKGPSNIMPSTARNALPTGKPQPQATVNSAPQAGQPPQSQQRTMVMPDRMRWIYRDPQGAIQGPWSGLEMHDWFKAGFFSAELLVKKYEDPEFEPLGQLIRRIGNSREPFLVPQIGIPHGPPSNQTSGPWNAASSSSSTNQTSSPAGSVQPPFAGAFPSFGTTLTAEQQNALERRKQEEQFLMARQKEYLAQQQVIQKQMQQMQGVSHGVHPQQLHHHSSAHSLHSQPSFGSITSPSVYRQTPPQAPIQPPPAVPGFMDAQMRQNAPGYMGTLGGPGSEYTASAPGASRDEELVSLLARQSLSHEGAPQPLGFGGPPFGQTPHDTASHVQPVAAMLAQRAQLQTEQMIHDSMLLSGPDGPQVPNERLQQFTELRARLDEDYPQHMESIGGKAMGLSGVQDQEASKREPQQQDPQGEEEYGQEAPESDTHDLVTPVGPSAPSKEPEVLSLTQQVQKAASAKQSPALTSQPEFGWGRTDKTGLPHPFPPPPQSLSPLPAPAAQRNRQHLPDALTIEQESRSRSQTSSVETPSAISSLAPWAKDVNDGPKGPSLKEIQEAEARKAAKAEEAAAAARRALLEQERSSQPTTSAPIQALASSSTWGSGTSPVTAGASAWGKPLAGKAGSGTGEGPVKKTLSQIQKEEEARRAKAAANATTPTSSTAGTALPGVSAGKRYADLAGKNVSTPAPGSNNAWTTVGASGKAKLPPVPAAGSAGSRVASGGSSSSVGVGAKAKPGTAPGKSAPLGNPLPGQPNANEAFMRWAKGALAKGLNSDINVDDFVQQLLMFPPETEIISESVYANSQTMDGRRFAEEFLRRRKLAEKGIVDASAGGNNGSSTGSGNEKKNASGWSEVAKKGPANAAKEAEASSPFKVVAAKKRGKKS